MPKDTTATGTKTATLYRMDMEKHTCPYGLKAKDLLEREGYTIEDHPLTTRKETEAVKERLGVKTTPQIFLGDERVGGYEDLRRALGKTVKDKNATSYQPVIAIFAVSFLMAMAVVWLAEAALTWAVIPKFVAIAMCFLGVQKLQNVETFSTMFLNYDLLAKRWVPYGYVYPFVETAAGVLMLAGVLTWLAVPAMLFIGTIGAVSVFKAVYVDKRELKCACVGGSSNVPLGFVSLTENLAMMGMGLWGLTLLF